MSLQKRHPAGSHRPSAPGPGALRRAKQPPRRTPLDFTFAIALTPRANSGDWALTQDLLALTLAGMAAQTAQDFRVLIAGHERPRLPADPRIAFLAAPWPVAPTGPHNDDSGRKKHWLAERVLERGGGLMMLADADDWVDRLTVETARRELAGEGVHGGVITHGHAVDLATLRVSPIPAPGVFGELHRVCGTSTVTVLRPAGATAGERDPFSVLRSHHAWLERAPELGLHVRRLSVGAAYVIGTSVNHSARLGPHLDWFRGFRRAVNASGAPLEDAALAPYGLDLAAVRAVSRRIAGDLPRMSPPRLAVLTEGAAAPLAAAPPPPQRDRPLAGADMPWVQVAPGAPYFVTDDGRPWTPVGYNDSISWVDLRPLYRRRDLAAVERHLRYVKTSGGTCIRLMLECLHGHNRVMESSVGVFRPRMIRLWDDLFALCAKVGLRLLLTPFDTFWTWLHWPRHPYNTANGGSLDSPARMLLDPGARAAIKARLAFAVERWGGSGVLFAWDLWNEIHPAQAEDCADVFPEFIADLSRHVRGLELDLYGRSHPQTVSLFGPELAWRPHMPLAEPIFRHPDLDFASIHIYAEGTIDHPANTVDPAVDMGRITAECLAQTPPDRPFLDTEHGPIHTFKDHRKTLAAAFDDEMFRHMQWAHLASGGAGGGMRWPNRRPHVLTPGMRRAQGALARFLPLIAWERFRRRNLDGRLRADGPVAAFGCGDAEQAVVYLLRRDRLDARGRVDATDAVQTAVIVPDLAAGPYRVSAFDPQAGRLEETFPARSDGAVLTFTTPPWRADLALAVRRSN